MQQSDPQAMLDGLVEVFIGFWRRNRLLIRRIHGIAAIDPEFSSAVEARNRRRRMAATRVVEMAARRQGQTDAASIAQKSAALYAITSFEFFDLLADACANVDDACVMVRAMASSAVLADN